MFRKFRVDGVFFPCKNRNLQMDRFCLEGTHRKLLSKIAVLHAIRLETTHQLSSVNLFPPKMDPAWIHGTGIFTYI